MSSVINEEYLKQAHFLSCLIDMEPEALKKLLVLINLDEENTVQNREDNEFFKAEHAFYSGQYEISLKHYLEAKNVSHFEFFCYRATAYILKGQAAFDKALEFVNRALAINPDDYMTIKLFRELLIQLDRHEEANGVLGRLENLSIIARENSPLPSATPDTYNTPKQVSTPVTNPLTTTSKADHLPFANLQNENRPLSIKNHLLTHYLTKWKNRKPIPDNCLYAFQGWQESGNQSIKSAEEAPEDFMLSMLYSGSHHSSGGFYLRWQGRGIAINPGKNFMVNFHQAGLNINDIDFVIVTNGNPNDYVDVQKIYNLTHQINQKVEGNVHLINYYISQQVYQELSNILKPHTKQEQHTVHKLELFADSPEGEHLNLSHNIKLHYFAVDKLNMDDFSTSPLGISLELIPTERLNINEDHTLSSASLNIGFIPNLSQSFLTHHQLRKCELLITRIHSTVEDNVRIFTESQQNAIRSFVEKCHCRLILCTEFDAYEGDLRLEIARKMREESLLKTSSTILPIEIGLFVDLATLRIKCDFTHTLVDPSNIRVVHSSGPFSQLEYISPMCCL